MLSCTFARSGESAPGLTVQQTVVRTAVPRHVLPAGLPAAFHGSHQLRDVQAEDVAPDPLLPLRRRNGPVRGDDDLQLHGVLPENAPVVPGCAPARRDEKLPDLRQQKRLFRVSVHDLLETATVCTSNSTVQQQSLSVVVPKMEKNFFLSTS
jgi:hypothetical protein